MGLIASHTITKLFQVLHVLLLLVPHTSLDVGAFAVVDVFLLNIFSQFVYIIYTNFNPCLAGLIRSEHVV